MQTWGIRCVRLGLSALILFAVAMPALAAAKPVRALHLVVANLSVADARHLIEVASRGRFNTILLGMPWQNGLLLRSTPWVVPGKYTWSRNDLVDVAEYARRKGLEVVPQIELLSHQEVLLASPFPGLMFNAFTYDPGNARTYEIVLPIIDEIIELLHPKAMHIGHDEVAGWRPGRNLLKQGERILPPDLFLEDVTRLHGYLRNKGIETWMWGDMLVSPEEFPSMREDALHGIHAGYGKELRRKIPRDIVICDWHYLDDQDEFPSLEAFKAEGFRVIGTIFKNAKTTRNFSHYAAAQGAEGMIATTWFIPGARNHAALITSWDELNQVVGGTGEIFYKDFPDAK